MRSALLAENKFTRYFFYAIGEIVLVVIGILIALQVNNWNQDRIIKKQEKILLSEIHDEFIYNKFEFENNVRQYIEARKNLIKIIDLFPINLQTTNLDSLAFYLEKTHFSGNYDYSNTSLKKIQNASSYNIISNEELRNLLLQWEVILADFVEEEQKVITHFDQHYVLILGNHFRRQYYKGFRDSRADLEFLSSLEFENLVDLRKRKISNLFRPIENNPYNKNIYQVFDRIIELTSEVNPQTSNELESKMNKN